MLLQEYNQSLKILKEFLKLEQVNLRIQESVSPLSNLVILLFVPFPFLLNPLPWLKWTSLCPAKRLKDL